MLGKSHRQNAHPLRPKNGSVRAGMHRFARSVARCIVVTSTVADTLVHRRMVSGRILTPYTLKSYSRILRAFASVGSYFIPHDNVQFIESF